MCVLKSASCGTEHPLFLQALHFWYLKKPRQPQVLEDSIKTRAMHQTPLHLFWEVFFQLCKFEGFTELSIDAFRMLGGGNPPPSPPPKKPTTMCRCLRGVAHLLPPLRRGGRSRLIHDPRTLRISHGHRQRRIIPGLHRHRPRFALAVCLPSLLAGASWS